MIYIQCQCLKCNHIGNVPVSSKTQNCKFVCSKCGSKKYVTVIRDTDEYGFIDPETDYIQERLAALYFDIRNMLPVDYYDDDN